MKNENTVAARERERVDRRITSREEGRGWSRRVDIQFASAGSASGWHFAHRSPENRRSKPRLSRPWINVLLNGVLKAPLLLHPLYFLPLNHRDNVGAGPLIPRHIPILIINWLQCHFIQHEEESRYRNGVERKKWRKEKKMRNR